MPLAMRDGFMICYDVIEVVSSQLSIVTVAGWDSPLAERYFILE